MNCAFQLPPRQGPVWASQSLSDTRDSRQNWTPLWRGIPLHSPLSREIKKCSSSHLHPPNLVANYCGVVGGWRQFVLAFQQDWKYWLCYPGMQLSSVDLKFHKPCNNIYACLPSPYALQLEKFTSIIFPSPLLIFCPPHYPDTSNEIGIPEREMVQLISVIGITFLSPPPHTGCHYHSTQLNSTLNSTQFNWKLIECLFKVQGTFQGN